MAVMRVNKTSDYTVMSNAHFKEREMSLKAKGLLSLMLSLPDTWDYSIAGLVTLSKDGKDSVMNALVELEEFGYLTRTRTTDGKGRFTGYDYDIYENPQTEKPSAEKPNTDNPKTENPQQLNTNISNPYKSNIKELNNKNKGTSPNARFIPPTIEEVRAYCQERQNGINAEQFVDYYTSKGWYVGKNKMKDWKASVRTWERNGFSSKTYGANGIAINKNSPDDLDGIL